MKVSGSCVVTPNSMLAITRDSKNAAGTPMAMPVSACSAPCADDVPRHLLRPGAKGEANPNFTLALADAIGDHAVDADEAQAEAGGGEDGQQESDEPRATERAGNHRGVRLHLGNGHDRINLERQLPHGARRSVPAGPACARPSPSGT